MLGQFRAVEIQARVLRSLDRTVFAEPCSPDIASNGYGPPNRKLAISQATINTKSSRLDRLSNEASASIDPPRSGLGIGNSGRPAKPDWRGSNDAPPVRPDLDRPPALIAKVEVDVASMFGDADVHRPLRRVEERASFEQIERGANRRAIKGCAGRFVMGAPQPSSKRLAADRPGLPLTVDREIRKRGARWGVKQLARDSGGCSQIC